MATDEERLNWLEDNKTLIERQNREIFNALDDDAYLRKIVLILLAKQAIDAAMKEEEKLEKNS